MNTVLSAATRQSLAALQMIADQLDATRARLTSGKRVNSAIDNPSAYFTASALSARAASLNQLMDRASDVKQMLTAADNGIEAIKSLLTAAQSLANSALQSPDTLVTVTGTNSVALTSGTVIATTAGSASTLKAGDTVTVSDGTTTATYTAADGDTVQTLLNTINGTSNLNVTASLNSSGQITFSATGTNNVTVGGTFGGVGTLNGVLGLTAGTTTFTANATRTSYAQQFDSILTQINSLASDAGYNGVNLLTGGSTSVVLNENGTSTVTVTGASMTSASLGVAPSTNNFQVDSGIATALASISNALTTLQAQAASLGSTQAIIDTRMDFTKSMARTLQDGADDLVASDPNADGAMMLALQTRQRLATAALSLASNKDTLILRLFGSN